MATVPKPPDEQEQDFDELFARGQVHIFPRLYSSRLRVFKETKEEALGDPAMPPLAEGPPAKRPKPIKEIDEEKFKRSADRKKGEEAEIKVIEMLWSGLQATTGPTDLPCFLLHDLDEMSHEIDAFILHRYIGVVLLETKAASKPMNLAHVKKATEQLTKRREKVYEKLKDLLRLGTIIQGVCLPNLESRGVDATDRMKQIRESHPQVSFLFGQDVDTYRQWLTELKAQADPLRWSSPDVDSDTAFRKAVERYLKEISPCSPATALTKMAAAHHDWILMPDQVKVRDRQDKLLHIWGPPGAGKTLLLVRKARLWLEGGSAVLLNVGYIDYDVLLSHLGRSVLHDNRAGTTSRLRFCVEFTDSGTGIEEMLKANKDLKPEQILVITDELRYESLKTLLEMANCWKQVAFWTASVPDLPSISSSLTEEAEELGWSRVEIKHSIRCPKYIVELLNQLVTASTSKWHASVQSYPVLPALAFTKPAVIRHDLHPDYTPLNEDDPQLACPQCRQELGEALRPLGENNWRHTVVLGTGEMGHSEKVQDVLVALLREVGMPVVWEKRRGRSNVVHQGQAGHEDDEASWRRRVVAGEDEEGKPAVHGLKVEDFHGLEKPVVVVVHWDLLDDLPAFQGEEHLKSRQADHADQWMSAVSRCQGQLILLSLSPSPACSLLDSPSSPTH